MLNDEDIIGNDDDDENEAAQMMASSIAEKAAAPDKWKRLEADLKRIRERETERDELTKLRQSLEEGN